MEYRKDTVMHILASGAAGLDPFASGYRMVLTVVILLVECFLFFAIYRDVRMRIKLGSQAYEKRRYERKGWQMGWERVLKRTWLSELATWGIALEGEHESESLKEIHRCWEIVHPMLYNILFTTIIMFIMLASLWMPGDAPDNTQFIWLFLTAAVPYFGYLVLVGIGYVRGLARLRREASRQITYADLRERRLSDYRSALFRWLPALFILSLLVSTLLAVPYLKPVLLVPLPFGGTIAVTTWIVGVALVAMIALFLITETQISTIVEFPRILVIADPEKAQQVDNMFRAKAIGELQGYELLSLFYFGVVTGALLLAALSSSAPGFIHTCIIVATLLGLLVFGGEGVTVAGKGHIGGTLSGWYWQKGRRKRSKQ